MLHACSGAMPFIAEFRRFLEDGRGLSLHAADAFSIAPACTHGHSLFFTRVAVLRHPQLACEGAARQGGADATFSLAVKRFLRRPQGQPSAGPTRCTRGNTNT